MYETLDTQIIERTLELMSFRDFFHSQSWLDFVETSYRECVPLSFYIQPASSSGKYHPSYSLGVGGLVRHTLATLKLAKMLFPLYKFSEKEEDTVLAALALHDIAKPDKLHPLMVEQILYPLREKYYSKIEKVIPLIESHMGVWDQFGKLPRPKSTLQKFVHLCDYLASRKSIIIEINERE